MTTNDKTIAHPTSTTNPALKAAWDTYQASLKAVDSANAELQAAITGLSESCGSKTFIIEGDIFQVRARTNKETGETLAYLTQYANLPSEGRRNSRENMRNEILQETLKTLKASDPAAAKALAASMGVTMDSDEEEVAQAPVSAKKQKRAAKSVDVTVE